jgi:hypothetical protein
MRVQIRPIVALGCWLSLFGLACSSSHSPSGGAKAHGTDPFGNSAGSGAGSGSGSGGTGVTRADGFGEACDQEGASRMCCDTGHQTCGGTVEFKQWGPCLDASGKQITCTSGGPNDCKSDEFAVCDGGTPPPSSCDDQEFPGCNGDGGLPPPPSLCTDKTINNEPEILAAYAPASGQSVSQGGQIKVWINDEWPELIAPGEQIDSSTGAILTPGDRTSKAPDGYLWEPALYIAPMTAESGGTPHFPQFIRGWYNNMPPANGTGHPMHAPGMMMQVTGTPGTDIEPPPPGTRFKDKYSTELIWNVDALHLGPGTYMGEFVILDGDRNRAIGCVTITITR